MVVSLRPAAGQRPRLPVALDARGVYVEPPPSHVVSRTAQQATTTAAARRVRDLVGVASALRNNEQTLRRTVAEMDVGPPPSQPLLYADPVRGFERVNAPRGDSFPPGAAEAPRLAAATDLSPQTAVRAVSAALPSAYAPPVLSHANVPEANVLALLPRTQHRRRERYAPTLGSASAECISDVSSTLRAASVVSPRRPVGAFAPTEAPAEPTPRVSAAPSRDPRALSASPNDILGVGVGYQPPRAVLGPGRVTEELEHPASAALREAQSQLAHMKSRNEQLAAQLRSEQLRRASAENDASIRQQRQQAEARLEHSLTTRIEELAAELGGERQRMSAQLDAVRAELQALRSEAQQRRPHRKTLSAVDAAEWHSDRSSRTAADPASPPRADHRRVMNGLVALEEEMLGQLRAVQAMQAAAPATSSRRTSGGRSAASDDLESASERAPRKQLSEDANAVFEPGCGPPESRTPHSSAYLRRHSAASAGSRSGRSTPSTTPVVRHVATPSASNPQSGHSAAHSNAVSVPTTAPVSTSQSHAPCVSVPSRATSAASAGAAAADVVAAAAAAARSSGSPSRGRSWTESPAPTYIDLDGGGTLPGGTATDAMTLSSQASSPLRAAAAASQAGREGSATAAGHRTASGALHAACEAGNCADVAAQLARPGVDVNARDADGWTPLHVAAQKGSGDCISLLLRAGADKDARDCDGSTPLVVACLEGCAAAAQALLDGGARADMGDDDGTTPLMVAAQAGRLHCVKLLLSRGVNPRQRDLHGRTARELSTEAKRRACTALLVEAEEQGREVGEDKPRLLAGAGNTSQLLSFV